MIKAIHFKNFKALRDTTLPLGPLTVLVGPNGSGKSTALEALALGQLRFKDALSVGLEPEAEQEIRVEIEWGDELSGIRSMRRGRDDGKQIEFNRAYSPTGNPTPEQKKAIEHILERARVYSLDAAMLADPVQMVRRIELSGKGGGLAGVLERLRDDAPERSEALNAELGRWLPEFDRILFETPQAGHKAIKLRTRVGQHAIPVADISQGTLLALAILTLAYLPDPPPTIGLEEPGRGIHPRLLRDVQDAIYRLAYPESSGEQREPVQVVATTHSPYFLDLFKDHPEEIVIANKLEGNVTFTRLTDLPNIDEILSGAPLGDVWYSGVLGGVPTHR